MDGAVQQQSGYAGNDAVDAKATAYARSIPDSVRGDGARDLYADSNRIRAAIKLVADEVNRLRSKSSALARTDGIDGDVPANIALAYRHLEDASMRLGKALQALDGGVSVYDRATTVGA
jgi:hypothetical protein